MKNCWKIATVACLLACAPAWALPPEEEPLQLSPPQARALRRIRSRYEGRLQDLQLQLQGRRLELAQMIRSDSADKATVKAKLNEIMSLEGERQQLLVDHLFEAKGQLNAEQWGPFRQRVLRRLLQDRRMGGQPRKLGSDPTSP